MRPNCVIRLDVNTSRLAVKYMAVTLVQSVAFSCYMTRALLIRLMVKRKLYHATTKRHKHIVGEQSRQHNVRYILLWWTALTGIRYCDGRT